SGCKTSGVYGNDCEKRCPTNCKDNVCHIQMGTCFGCTPGWKGTTCNTKCEDGTYGNYCVHNCSGNCLNDSHCNRETGHCDTGCKPGYINALCNEACRYGYYGKNCSRVCFPNCRTCNHTDGSCTCYAGWSRPDCTNGCMWSYGEDCRYPCSKHCVNQTCDIFNGSCLSGCDRGYYGPKCDQGLKLLQYTLR
uniref:Protein draper-like n=1 Tax=Crassostrea virginica TaxID=6565 RepID=A0A8B8BR14_CRAVI